MPRVKKNTKKTKTTRKVPVTSRKVSAKKRTVTETKPWFWMQSYTSLLLGVVVVIIGILFIATVTKVKHTQETSSISTVATPTPAIVETTTQKQQTYVVQEGDDLWHISEKFYKTGYNYVAIIKANNLSDPSVIHVGDTLIMPASSPTPEPSSFNDENTELQTPIANGTQTPSIKTATYTVQQGDDLWDIAVKEYGDGYKWTEIARANNLTDPGLIFSGNVLQIPR